jgi:hypothetical protein
VGVAAVASTRLSVLETASDADIAPMKGCLEPSYLWEGIGGMR